MQVTAIARRMVGRWGMSPAIGKLTVLPDEDGRAFPGLPRGLAAHHVVTEEDPTREAALARRT